MFVEKIIRLLKRLDFPEMKFSLYFLGYEVKFLIFCQSFLSRVTFVMCKCLSIFNHMWFIYHKPSIKHIFCFHAESCGSTNWSSSKNCLDLWPESHTWTNTVRKAIIITVYDMLTSYYRAVFIHSLGWSLTLHVWLFCPLHPCFYAFSNWGTESDPAFKGYHNGNSEPRGFGLHLQTFNRIFISELYYFSEAWMFAI